MTPRPIPARPAPPPAAANADPNQPTSLENHVHAVLTLMRELAREVPVPSLDLEEKLGVSGRTLRRYIAALKHAGFDIQTRRGKGYQLRFTPEKWSGFLPVSVLQDLATLQVVNQALPVPTSKAERSLSHLIEDLMADASGDLQKAQHRLQRALLWREEVPRQNQSAAANLRLCLRAIVHLHPIQFDYTDRTGAPSARTIEPLGCLYTTGTWYCVAHDRTRKERRNFVLERMSNVQLRYQETYKYPEAFNLEREYTGAWGVWKTQGPEPVEFLVDAGLSQFFIECEFPYPNKKTRKKDGRLAVRTSSADLPATARWLAPYADALTVVLPKELRQELIDRASATITRHQ